MTTPDRHGSAETVRIREALAEVYRPDGVDLWMTAPHRSFGGLSATEMIERGRTEEVLAEIERLATGAFG
jgi:hypothetical protein